MYTQVYTGAPRLYALNMLVCVHTDVYRAPRLYALNMLVRVHTGVYRDIRGKCSFKSLSLDGWSINTLLIRKRSLWPRTHFLKGH